MLPAAALPHSLEGATEIDSPFVVVEPCSEGAIVREASPDEELAYLDQHDRREIYQSGEAFLAALERDFEDA